MPKNLSSEENFKILEKLPEDLKNTLFSSEASDHIGDICKKFKVPAEKISLVAEVTGRVISRMLPLENFKNALERVVELNKETAENVASEIDFRIFSNVRESLKTTIPKIQPRDEKISLEIPTPETKEKLKRPPRKDIYHEPIE